MPKIETWSDFQHFATDLVDSAPKKLFITKDQVLYSGLTFDRDGIIRSATGMDTKVIAENKTPEAMAKILELFM